MAKECGGGSFECLEKITVKKTCFLVMMKKDVNVKEIDRKTGTETDKTFNSFF